jgi:CRP-like cAMP-binding protein
MELPPHVRQALAKEAKLVEYRKNQKVIEFGQPVPSVLAVRSGLLAVIHSPDQEKPSVDFARPSDLYAESTAGDNISSSEVLALMTSTVVQFPVHAFRNAMLSHAPFGLWYVNVVENQRNQQYLHRVQMRTLKDEARFAYFLWTLADVDGDDRRILRTKLPERIIALYLGVGREQVNRKKQLLEKTGYITQTDGGIVIDSSLATLFAFEGPASYSSEAASPKVYRPPAQPRP